MKICVPKAAVLLLAISAGIFLTAGNAPAAMIYAATGGSSSGSLYTLDGTDGSATLVGALVDGSGNAYALSGLAFHPTTGVLYGATSNSSPTATAHLVTVDPLTGLVTDIGLFGPGSTMSDITFVGSTLYGMRSASGHLLTTINLLTGAATDIAGSGTGAFGGGGLAASSSGLMFLTPDSATNPPGSLYTIDTAGTRTFVATLSGAPVVSSGGGMFINAMDFDGSTLLGINNTSGGGGGATHRYRAEC